MSSYRLDTGGTIDRRRRIAFTFDGRPIAAHPGDTVASALLAAGVRLVGRSFKYHRPRGLVAAGVEEPNGLVTLRQGGRREPNTPATVAEVSDGLVVAVKGLGGYHLAVDAKAVASSWPVGVPITVHAFRRDELFVATLTPQPPPDTTVWIEVDAADHPGRAAWARPAGGGR